MVYKGISQTQTALQAENTRLAETQTALQVEAAKSTEATTRPWLTSSAVLDGKTGEVKVGFRNSGHTPTRLATVAYAQFFVADIEEKDLQERLYFRDDLSFVQPKGLSLFNIGSDTQSIESARVPFLPLSAVDISDVHGRNSFSKQSEILKQMKAATLYVWGAMLYEDVLHNLHEAKFCYWHKPNDGTKLFACPFVNALDEEVSPRTATCVTPQLAGKPTTDHQSCVRTSSP